MNKFLILGNNGSKYQKDPRWPKYNVTFLSWFLSFTEYDIEYVLDQPRTILVERVEKFISNLSPDDVTFIYMTGIGGKRNCVNGFIAYEDSTYDESIIDIVDILGKFQGKPVIIFIDVFSPRTSFQKFDFVDYSIENCYIGYNCSDMQWPFPNRSPFTGGIIYSLFGHSGSTLSNVLDSFQAVMNQNRKTKGRKACAYDSLHSNIKQVYLQGVLNNQDYQLRKHESTDFNWVWKTWEKLKNQIV